MDDAFGLGKSKVTDLSTHGIADMEVTGVSFELLGSGFISDPSGDLMGKKPISKSGQSIPAGANGFSSHIGSSSRAGTIEALLNQILFPSFTVPTLNNSVLSTASPVNDDLMYDASPPSIAGGKGGKAGRKKLGDEALIVNPISSSSPSPILHQKDNLLTDLVDKDRAARLRKLKQVDLLQDPVPNITQEMMMEVASACGFLIQGDPAVTFARLQEIEGRGC